MPQNYHFRAKKGLQQESLRRSLASKRTRVDEGISAQSYEIFKLKKNAHMGADLSRIDFNIYYTSSLRKIRYPHGMICPRRSKRRMTASEYQKAEKKYLQA